MTHTYDNYYQTENLFGKPYPELIEFFAKCPKKGKVLDLGCGQGRDSIPIAQLGYTVTGIDNSKVGIEQMNRIAKNEKLNLTGKVTDIYEYDNFTEYDFILLDSMFHFAKRDRKKETEFISKIIREMTIGSLLLVCIQDTGNKIEILKHTVNIKKQVDQLTEKSFKYVFYDNDSDHKSHTNYKMIVLKKIF